MIAPWCTDMVERLERDFQPLRTTPGTRKKGVPSPMDAFCFTDTVDPRRIITPAGERILHEAYAAAAFSTPTQHTQRQLASRLNVTLAAVKRWFQNHCRGCDPITRPASDIDSLLGSIEERIRHLQSILDLLEGHRRSPPEQ